jgi:hypothetical protein
MAKNRKYEHGQALAETAVGLIAIAFVFLGLLFISGLGIESIKTLLKARGGADSYAYNGTLGTESASNIIDWEKVSGEKYGPDELPFTYDDPSSKNEGSTIDFSVFSGELNTDNFSLADNMPDYDQASYNFAADDTIWDSNVFVNAADLVGYQESQTDPLGARGLNDLKSAFRSLILNEPNLSITETVFMTTQ